MIKPASLKFGDYYVIDILGQGAMGIVYKGRDPQGHFVAIKTLKKLVVGSLRERFFQEISISRNLIHPNIAIPLDFAQEPEPYIVFEFVDGFSLDRALRERDWLRLETAIHMLEQISRGLKYVHDLGIVHGDLNPRNILLTRDHRGKIMVKIIDFGISKVESALVKIGQGHVPLADGALKGLYGTPGYICPELFKSHQYTTKSDLFSFGVIAHEVLTGVTPFPGDTVFRTIEPPHIKQVCDVFNNTFARILHQDPTQRYDSAPELFRALRHLAHSIELQKLWEHNRNRTLTNRDKHFRFDTHDLLSWEHSLDPFFSQTQTVTLSLDGESWPQFD